MSYMIGTAWVCSEWCVDELTFTFGALTLLCLKPDNQCQSIPQYFIYILSLYVFIAHHKKEEEEEE